MDDDNEWMARGATVASSYKPRFFPATVWLEVAKRLRDLCGYKGTLIGVCPRQPHR